MMRGAVAIAALSLAVASCAHTSPSSMLCRGGLGSTRDERELRLATHEATSVRVGPYTIGFAIVEMPSRGRGTVQINWAGAHITPGATVGSFDARKLGSIRGQLKVPEGTLSHDCGAVCGFA